MLFKNLPTIDQEVYKNILLIYNKIKKFDKKLVFYKMGCGNSCKENRKSMIHNLDSIIDKGNEGNDEA